MCSFINEMETSDLSKLYNLNEKPGIIVIFIVEINEIISVSNF
jgi:hypothetical protein